MQQVWIPQTGAPDVLELREATDPTPRSGEVLIAVEAAGINFADILARQGLYHSCMRIICGIMVCMCSMSIMSP
ncbi:MAG: hypothetical protein HKN04_02885 [Rhodothermaceae bacterium]|nr:hypothetical protein [Rhodothermaceae bacterium]